MQAGVKRGREYVEGEGSLDGKSGKSKLARFRAWKASKGIAEAHQDDVESKKEKPATEKKLESKMDRLKKLAARRKAKSAKEDTATSTPSISDASSLPGGYGAPAESFKKKGVKFKGFKARIYKSTRKSYQRKRSTLTVASHSNRTYASKPAASAVLGGLVGKSEVLYSSPSAAPEYTPDLEDYLASIGVATAGATSYRPTSSSSSSTSPSNAPSSIHPMGTSIGGAISGAVKESEAAGGSGGAAGGRRAVSVGGALTADDLAEAFGIGSGSAADAIAEKEAGASSGQASMVDGSSTTVGGTDAPMEDRAGTANGRDSESEEDEYDEKAEEDFRAAFLRLATAPTAAGSSQASGSEAEGYAEPAGSIAAGKAKSSSSSSSGSVIESSSSAGASASSAAGYSALESLGPKTGGMQTGEDLLDSLFVGDEWTGASTGGANDKSTATSVLAAFQQKQARRLQNVGASSASGKGAGGEAIPVVKSIYRPASTIARKRQHVVQNERAQMGLRVRGRDIPAPIDSWHQCGVNSSLLRALQTHGYEQPFAIQRQAIPCIMSGRDIIGVAKTGSGKTLAFVLPALRHAMAQPPLEQTDGPLVVILAPMRELAMQLYEETRKLGVAVGLRVVPVYGGAPIAEYIAGCKSTPHVIVGTPGRMIDLMALNGGKVLRLNRASMLVLDEADRMFDMGFGPQVEQVVNLMRPDKYSVLFSATFPEHIVKLARGMLIDPVEVVVGGGKSVASDAVRQKVEVRSPKTKFARLLQLLGEFVSKGQVLVFVDTKEACDDLFTSLMGAGYEPLTLHGGKDQYDRDETLDEFRKGERELLVATSVAGRGLDVPGICLVVNYDCPSHLEDYVHRVGRTGRAGRKGDAVTFLQPDQGELAPDLVRALTDANQVVPDALQSMAEEHKDKVRRGEAKKRRSGFTNRGRRVDGTEVTEVAIGYQIERLRLQMQQGALDEDTFLRLEAELEDKLAEVRDGKGKRRKAREEAKAREAEAAAAGPLPTAKEMAVLRAKASAAEAAIAAGRGASDAAREAITKYQEAEAALTRARLDEGETARARARAQEALVAMGGGGSGGKANFTQEMDINGYPKTARSKALRPETLQNIAEWFGCGVITTGIYVPLGRKPPAGERPLTLVIEGESEVNVRRARAELRRMLDEATADIDEERYSLEAAMAGGNGMGGGSGGASGGLDAGKGYGK